ncbi:MAG: thioredoxin [Myxococcales bacterium]|nr:thioredoxin [Myxococcales bacterium]
MVREIILLVLALVGCGAAGIPKDSQRTVLSLANLDCTSCGEALAGKLGKHAGVYQAAFDRRRSELTVAAVPTLDVLASAKGYSEGEEFTLVLGAGKGGYLPWAKPPEGADVKVIAADGADVPVLAPHLVAGKVTVVDFAAAWCEPCRTLDTHLMGVIAKRSDVAYRKLDIGDWDSPLAARYLKGVRALPYVIVFAKDGRKVAAIAGLELARVDAAIDEAAK